MEKIISLNSYDVIIPTSYPPHDWAKFPYENSIASQSMRNISNMYIHHSASG